MERRRLTRNNRCRSYRIQTSSTDFWFCWRDYRHLDLPRTDFDAWNGSYYYLKTYDYYYYCYYWMAIDPLRKKNLRYYEISTYICICIQFFLNSETGTKVGYYLYFFTFSNELFVVIIYLFALSFSSFFSSSISIFSGWCKQYVLLLLLTATFVYYSFLLIYYIWMYRCFIERYKIVSLVILTQIAAIHREREREFQFCS